MLLWPSNKTMHPPHITLSCISLHIHVQSAMNNPLYCNTQMEGETAKEMVGMHPHQGAGELRSTTCGCYVIVETMKACVEVEETPILHLIP